MLKNRGHLTVFELLVYILIQRWYILVQPMWSIQTFVNIVFIHTSASIAACLQGFETTSMMKYVQSHTYTIYVQISMQSISTYLFII